MAVRNVLLFPWYEEQLRQESKPVLQFDKDLRSLVTDLFDTIREHPAVGLSAPQIGVHQRVFLSRFGQREDGKGKLSRPRVFVNPEIVDEGPLERNYDGCLSIRGLQGYTVRPASITVRAFDERGKRFKDTWSGLDARVIHHEIDHLNGVLYLDRIQDIDKDLYAVVQDEDGFPRLISYGKFIRSLQRYADDPVNQALLRMFKVL